MWSILSNHARHIGTHSGAIVAYITQRRFVWMTLAVVVAAVGVVGFVLLRQSAASQKTRQDVVSKSQHSSVSTSVSNTSSQPAAITEQETPSQPTQPTSASVSRSDSGATVKINNETIQLPKNGSVQRTIQDNNGTTNVNVSVNSNSSGTTTSSSMNVSTSSTSQSSQSSQSSVSINNSQ